MKIMTLARNQITFAGGCLIYNAAAFSLTDIKTLPHGSIRTFIYLFLVLPLSAYTLSITGTPEIALQYRS